MPYFPGPDAVVHVMNAKLALHIVDRELGELLGVSTRTVQRMMTRRSSFRVEHLQLLARKVHPTNPALAAALAAEGGVTLEALGLVKPAPPAAPSPPPRAFPPPHLLVEVIVCAAADAMQSTPSAVRDVLRAAFSRARTLGLTVEEVDAALAPPPQPAAPAKGKPAKA
jgi:hypothetical protein